MSKIMKIFAIILTIPVILVIGVIGFLKFADLNNYKADIEKLARKYADIDLKINGDLGVAVSLKPTIELSDVYISDSNTETKIARIGNALVQFSILPLLHKEIAVEKVQTDNTEIFYNDKDSVLINDLDLSADGYDAPINIAFDTTVSGIDIFGSAEIDSFKKIKENNYDGSDIKADVKAMGYDLQYTGLISGLQDKIKASGKYELAYKKVHWPETLISVWKTISRMLI